MLVQRKSKLSFGTVGVQDPGGWVVDGMRRFEWLAACATFTLLLHGMAQRFFLPYAPFSMTDNANFASQRREAQLSQDAHQFSISVSQRSVSRLHVLEHARSKRWNNSAAAFIVLGLKAPRDFGVFAWSFGLHGFKLAAPKQSYLNLTHGPPDAPPLGGIGSLLCHSLFLSNCVHGYRGDLDRADGGIYGRLRGMKINRIAGVRQVLSTKDGLCHTLQRSGLLPFEVARFGFPCWVLPADGGQFLRYLQGASDFSLPATTKAQDEVTQLGDQGRKTTLNGDLPADARNGSRGTAKGTEVAYIVKPARGSQGQGIRVLEAEAVKAQLSNANLLNGLRSPLVVQPYLRDPLLHNGRKWDVRTYVLATSVLPMRLYLFSEAIVRYAVATQYNSTSKDVTSVLTNTFVGKQILKEGVGSITASIADLCDGPDPVKLGSSDMPNGERASAGDGESAPFALCSTRLVDEMREAIGHSLLAAEPQLEQYYRQQYSQLGKDGSISTRSDEGESRGLHTSSEDGAVFRCSECYHLLGVDLIADAIGKFKVIEVNVSPDLSLSTQGSYCQGTSTRCKGGSTAYDHTKLAVGYNTVHLVYARDAVASRLERIVQRNAMAIARLNLVVSLAGAESASNQTAFGRGVPTLHADAAEYLLDALRERAAAGCFTPVYPSAAQHEAYGKQLSSMARGVLPTLKRSLQRRLQMHQLLGIVLADIDEDAGGKHGFRVRCDQMLREVPHVTEGQWARRSHIFRRVWDLRP